MKKLGELDGDDAIDLIVMVMISSIFSSNLSFLNNITLQKYNF